MARLEAQSKLLYYPTPEPETDMIASYFTGDGVRLVDPCCGTGAALARFGAHFKDAELLGIELSFYRAQEARKVLKTVLPTSFYDVKWDERSVGLIFNNPPYDWSDKKDKDGHTIRHEVMFVAGCTPRLVPGGHQVIIIPRFLLGHTGLIKHLVGWYEKLIVVRFPDPDYERFSQVVIMACGKREKYTPPSDDVISVYTELAPEEKEIPTLAAVDEPWFTIPQASEKFRFTYKSYQEADLVEAGVACSPLKTDEFKKLTYVAPLGAPFHPATPLQIGHMTMLISGQNVGVIKLEDEAGSFLLKGMTTKEESIQNEQAYDERGKATHVNVTTVERLVTTICTASADGELAVEKDVDKVGEIITKHAAKIAKEIQAKNTPIYDYHPTKEEWGTVSKIGMGLPPLPGRTERGLFDAQKHLAIGTARVLKEMGAAIDMAEMGYGKSITTVASLTLLDAWPVILECPGQLVFKWKRELEMGADPDKPIVGRVITRPTIDAIDKVSWIKARRLIEEHGVIVDTYKNQNNPKTEKDIPGTRNVRVRTTQVARLLKVFDNAMFSQGQLKPAITLTDDGIAVEYPDKDDYTLEDFVTDYKAGRLGKRAVAISSIDTAKYDAGDKEEFKFRYVEREVEGRYSWQIEKRKFPVCPVCGEPLEKRYRFCPNDVYDGKVEGEKTYHTCGGALFEMSRWRRTGSARLVQQKYNKFFRAYVSDETHKNKSGRTDAGVADMRLISATEYSIALTGTLFGGNASSLFYLLYRRLRALRNRFDYTDQEKWVEEYGLWEKSWMQGKPYEGEVGKATGIQRWQFRQKEIPGISPSVIEFLLPITLFGEISDLGYELPPVDEKVVWLDMGDKLGDHYTDYNKAIFDKAIELAMEDKDPGGLSVWFSTMRRRTASAFREEEANYMSRKAGRGFNFTLESVVDNDGHAWLPKEEELAKIVKANMDKNRKTLIYVEQSATRDIRDRLNEALVKLAPGCRVGKLSAGDMSPAKRELWIRNAAKSMDVLLCNPKLVETGLDLVMFSDITFYETPTSLYTMWQAMRRVWRLGQKSNVMVWFLAHPDTIEASLLARMGKKKKAAQLLYGKSASGVLCEQEGGDVQAELIREALAGTIASSTREALKDISIFLDESRPPVETYTAVQPVETVETTTEEPIPVEIPIPVGIPEPAVVVQPEPISTSKWLKAFNVEGVKPFNAESLKPFKPDEFKGKTVQLGLFGDVVEVKRKKKD